jgi:hypothetical protein
MKTSPYNRKIDEIIDRIPVSNVINDASHKRHTHSPEIVLLTKDSTFLSIIESEINLPILQYLSPLDIVRNGVHLKPLVVIMCDSYAECSIDEFNQFLSLRTKNTFAIIRMDHLQKNELLKEIKETYNRVRDESAINAAIQSSISNIIRETQSLQPIHTNRLENLQNCNQRDFQFARNRLSDLVYRQLQKEPEKFLANEISKIKNRCNLDKTNKAEK